MTTLQDRLRQVRELAAEASSLGIEVPVQDQDRQHIDVAVVGEIKRGKSTFLNALMRAKIFPSRAQVCTSAVTVLIDAPLPGITIRYLDPIKRPEERHDIPPGHDVFDILMSVVAKPVRRKDGIQGNPDASGIDEVLIGYPNRFATDGIRLVDTPGVNDPDAWREEITYSYLGRADAAIMLLDPQQPLSSSEVSFLRDKVQTRVRRQLLFVLNKTDQVSAKDLETSLTRIRRELTAWVPEPRVYPLSAKAALEAHCAGKPLDDGFSAFERDLDDFLRRGRAGGLLTHRVDIITDCAARRESSLLARMEDLEREQNQVTIQLDKMERLVEEKRRELHSLNRVMHSWIDGQSCDLATLLRGRLAEWRAAISSNPGGVRAGLDQLPRDLVSALEEAGGNLVQGLIKEFGERAHRAPGALVTGRIAVGALNGSAFASTQGTTPHEGVVGIGSGIALGMMVGGPIGALIGGIVGGFLRAHGKDLKVDQQKDVAAMHEYLNTLEHAIQTKACELARVVGTDNIPLLCQPLECAIAEETTRIQTSRRDIAQTSPERTRIRRDLDRERTKIGDFLKRCAAVQEELGHV